MKHPVAALVFYALLIAVVAYGFSFLSDHMLFAIMASGIVFLAIGSFKAD